MGYSEGSTLWPAFELLLSFSVPSAVKGQDVLMWAPHHPEPRPHRQQGIALHEGPTADDTPTEGFM